MGSHGEGPATTEADPADPEGHPDVRTAMPPPKWGGPDAQYTDALPEIPKAKPKSSRSARARHRRAEAAARNGSPAAGGEAAPEADGKRSYVPAEAEAGAAEASGPVHQMGPLPVVPVSPPAPNGRPVLDGHPPIQHPTRPIPTKVSAGQVAGPPVRVALSAPDPWWPASPDMAAVLVGWVRCWPVRRLSVGGLIATLGAIVLVIGSFAPFVAYGGPAATLRRLPDSYPAWSMRTFMFPLSVLPVILAVVVVLMMVAGVRRASGTVPLPLGSRQVMVVAAFGALLILSGYAVSAKAVVFDPAVFAPAAAGLSLSFGGGGLTMWLARRW
ncbi:hypothetical protein [Fodinicola feengrottensis]|uniref:hypothetical protein n=1 Tax=Fodinicola feengrottensis TaxID=435914 RepID=UPI0013D2BCF4|nr:hypothetical protein [Fodinicola feengrottensis]